MSDFNFELQQEKARFLLPTQSELGGFTFNLTGPQGLTMLSTGFEIPKVPAGSTTIYMWS